MNFLMLHCAAVVFASLLVVQSGQSPANAFIGSWAANLSKSKQHPDDRFQSQTLDISIAGETVTIFDTVVNASGAEERRTNIFQTDGKEHPHPSGQGFVLVARSLGRVIEATAKKDGQADRVATFEET